MLLRCGASLRSHLQRRVLNTPVAAIGPSLRAGIQARGNASAAAAATQNTERELPPGGLATAMTNPELETLKVRGGKMDRRAMNAISSILRSRMTDRLPTLLEFQGPSATLNAVKSIAFANNMLRGRKKIENVTSEEFDALKEYLSNRKSLSEPLKIGSDFQYFEKFSVHEGYDVVEDIVADSVEIPVSGSTNDSESTANVRPVDPNRIPWETAGEERNKMVMKKLEAHATTDPPVKHVMVGQERPVVLGFIPSQFRVAGEEGHRFVMRFEPVIIAEAKSVDKSNAKLIFPPRDRDMLFNAAQVVRKLWTEYLEASSGGGESQELLCSAAGAESVSRVVKMLECANTLQEKNSGTQFCVRPKLVRQPMDAGEEPQTNEDGTEMLRFNYEFDFYAL